MFVTFCDFLSNFLKNTAKIVLNRERSPNFYVFKTKTGGIFTVTILKKLSGGAFVRTF